MSIITDQNNPNSALMNHFGSLSSKKGAAKSQGFNGAQINRAQDQSSSQNVDPKQAMLNHSIHKAAKGFVGVFLSQFASEVLRAEDLADGDSFETEFMKSMLGDELGKKLADSSSATHLVTHVENKMRRQAGLEELKTGLQQEQNLAHPANQSHEFRKASAAYANSITKEQSHVSAAAA